MNPLWLLKGRSFAPGWPKLQQDHHTEKIDVLHFDRDAWALVYADEAPQEYEGLTAIEPPDGVYLDVHGRPCYVSNCAEVHSARAVLRGLGEEGQKALDQVGDPDLALERLGRAF